MYPFSRRASRFVFAVIAAILVVAGGSTATAEEPPDEADEHTAEVPDDEASDETEAPGDARVTLAPGEGLRIRSADGDYGLNVRGIFQGHFEYETSEGQPDHNSFFLRLLRVDAQGHALTEDLTFRLMPEFARSTFLLDGWVSYRFSEAFQLRGGQFNVPFNWERHVSPIRHQFGDRSVANNEFQWPGGRDIGLMAHGDPVDQIRYGVGLFSGQGMNSRRSDSEGLLATGRLVYTPVGDYQTTEILVDEADGLNLSFGAGAMFALRNNARDWAAWDDQGTGRADVVNTTADVSLRWSRLSAHATGFYRRVTPGLPEGAEQLPDAAQPDPLERFDGVGYAASSAVLILPRRLAGVLRYSEARPNLDSDLGRQRELLGGVHLFHRGLDSRFQLQAGIESDYAEEDGWQNDFVANAQYQLLF